MPTPPEAGSPAAKGAKVVQVQFKASDGKAVFADFYRAETPAGIVLLFHQAGSNAGEYAPIAPRLVKDGFDCLAVDQRSGGTRWGRKNRTGNQSQNYMSAYRDMEGAFAWAQAHRYKNISVWGSSYSASLVLKLAGEHKVIACVLAFSPGEYFGGDHTVGDWNMRNPAPTLMAFSTEERDSGGVSLYQRSSKTPARNRHDLILAFPGGVHGSSTLRDDKNKQSARQYWVSVISFLKTNGR